VGTSASKNVCLVNICGAYALKNIQKVPSARKKSSLTKGGVYWPYHNEQRHWPNVEKVGPRSVVPRQHDFAWIVGDPRSLP
jgi:hypothetical protein